MSKSYRLQILLYSSLLLGADSAYGKTLNDLAKAYVERIGGAYNEGAQDKAVDKPLDRAVKFNPLDQIREGSQLLLRPRSQKIEFDAEIFALKRNGAVYLAFEDFIGILELAITYDSNKRIAQGWYLREDWIADINFPQKTVSIKGDNFTINDTDVFDDNGLLYVSSDKIEEWFDLKLEYNISDQVINIETPIPLPAIARISRKNKKDRGRRASNIAELPRLEQDRKLFDLNTAAITLGSSFQRTQTGSTDNAQSSSIIAEGEILEHNAFLLGSVDTTNGFRNATVRLSRRSEDADLLGPLNAKAYAFGDVDVTNIPLSGTSSQQAGFRFDNNSFDNVDFAATSIEGDITPGWDVELYRNGVLLDTLSVNQNGRYEFDNIQLFAGDNDFELFFFGPQGEIRTEDVSIPVSADLLSQQDNTYEVSVTLEDTNVIQGQAEDEDENTLHVAARYNRLITPNSLGFVGLRSRETGGERNTILSAGATSTIGKTFLDTNVALNQDGGAALELIARRNIAGWSLSAFGEFNTDDFSVSDIADPNVLDLSFNASRPFLNSLGRERGSLLFTSNYIETSEGSSFTNIDLGISNRLLSRTNLSNRLQYERTDTVGSDSTETDLEYTSSLQHAYKDWFFRLSSTYGLRPDTGLVNTLFQANYRPSNEFSSDLTLQRDVISDRETARLNLNYVNDYFRLTPFIEANTDEEVRGGLTVNFNIDDQPDSLLPDIRSRRSIGLGTVSAFVYHDKNGNLIFDGDDLPLEGVVVESLNTRRREVSGTKGYATLRNLGITRATDIRLDGQSLPDPFMLPATQGNSVLPEAGIIHDMQFPVHLTGEIEGVASYTTPNGIKVPAPFLRLTLYSLDHPDRDPITLRTESDGFYVAFLIPPGRYLLDTMALAKGGITYGNPLPQIITIGYDGTILRDINVDLQPNQNRVSYEVRFEDKLFNATSYNAVFNDAILKVKKSSGSVLAGLVGQLIKKRFTNNVLAPLKQLDHRLKDTDGTSYDLYVSNSPEELHKACSALRERSVECSIAVPPVRGPIKVAQK